MFLTSKTGKVSLKHRSLGILSACILVFSVRAEVTLDGTFGSAGSLEGSDFQISADLGLQTGGNLFHSFGRFNIGENESANFTGPDNIQNILGRVTEGPSTIDGAINSTIPGANLFLMNPAGIVFGPGAKLDVQGAFYSTTADYIALQDGGRFNADPSPNEIQMLTAQPPEAFGFLSPDPEPITVEGSTLNPGDGNAIALVGGDIMVREATLSASGGGAVQLASARSTGEITLTDEGLATSSVTERGTVSLSGGSSLDLLDFSGQNPGRIVIRAGQFTIEEESSLGVLSFSSGTHIDIEANDIQINNSDVFVFGDDADVTIKAERSLEVADASSIQTLPLFVENGGDVAIEADSFTLSDGSYIETLTQTSGDSGNVTIAADHVLLAGQGITEDDTRISSVTSGGTGNAGSISITSRTGTGSTLHVRNGARISSLTSGQGEAGDIEVTIDRITLTGDPSADFTGIISQTMEQSIGRGGDIALTTNMLAVQNGAEVNTITSSAGSGGNIDVKANEIELVGDAQSDFTGISSQADNESIEDAGDIVIETGSLDVRAGAAVSSDTFGGGDAGEVQIRATEEVLLTGDGSERFTGISSQTNQQSTGSGGDITMTAGSLGIRNGAQISASTRNAERGGDISVTAEQILLSGDGAIPLTGITARASSESTGGDAGDILVTTEMLEVGDGAEINATTAGRGKGGNVEVRANDITVSDDAAITAQSTIAGLGSGDPGEVGKSGDIRINARDNLRLLNGGAISVRTEEANAGSIEVQAGELLHLRNKSSITTSAAGGNGGGGDILIDPVFVVLDGGSRIVAGAREGAGGNIQIVTDFLFRSPDSEIDASSELGVDGNVEIDSPDTDVISGTLGLPESLLNISGLLNDRCAARTQTSSSSFVVSGRGGVPPGPEMGVTGPGPDTCAVDQYE